MLVEDASVMDAMTAVIQSGRSGSESQELANMIVAAYRAINKKIYSSKTDDTNDHDFMRMLDVAEDVSLLCAPLAEKFLAGGSEDDLKHSLREVLSKLQESATAPNDGAGH